MFVFNQSSLENSNIKITTNFLLYLLYKHISIFKQTHKKFNKIFIIC